MADHEKLATDLATANSTSTADLEKTDRTQEDVHSVEDSEKNVTSRVDGDGEGQEPGQYIDIAAEKRLVRKIDLNVVPILFFMCKYSHAHSHSD